MWQLLWPATCLASEPWGDSRLPVVDGLEYWLDAGRASGGTSLPAEGPVIRWLDASGKGRHLSQDDASSQPALVRADTSAIIRFDGVDDHFRATKLGAKLDSFTLIIVAAPRSNIGSFRGFLAMNAPNEKDYTSGLTVDLGPWASARFSALNVEGRGFVGAQNLRNRESTFGKLHTLRISSAADESKVRLSVDGQLEGERPRSGEPISFDEFTLGARYYNNTIGPQRVDGYSRIDVAEVLLYGRVLTPAEVEAVEKYLDDKYAAIRESLPSDSDVAGEPLQAVDDPPEVQVFVPGFSVRQLPLELTNINNVKFRTDGTLVALGYDGRIWLLRDVNGDGLEEKAELFWDNPRGLRSPIGMDLTPPDYVHGDGVFVVGKTRCVLIVDTDGDDRADKEIDVASGWKESFHPVDGLGVAFDPRDGSIYFGRGTYNFADPLLRDAEGKPQYNLSDESGAIIHVAPDFKSRKIFATGIRFPVAIRLNERGELFATDQEGATWVPNGNPFDELLHVQEGRHYGFPARHPLYVPNVIDEPSTLDYAPQHQSICGFNFNQPVRPGGEIFGPAAWAGDAIVTGYSRGKLYRTQLVKSEAGYIAKSQILACLKMLTVDACVGPDGGLIVACHSGGPDWGSGPTGTGKLLKIEYVERDRPQPVFVWATGPQEIRVEFDRPVDPQSLRDVLSRAKLSAGRYVRAGDRFESLWPGYAAVQRQKLAPRFHVSLHSAQLTPDGRTLVLAADPMRQAVHYALMLPSEVPSPKTGAQNLPQHAAIDLDFDLTGCAASFVPSDGGAAWTGWLPHFDLDVSRRFTSGSATHDALWAALKKPGELTMRGQIDLVDMLRPAVQPASEIDYQYPPEDVTVTFVTASPGVKLDLKTPWGNRRVPTGDSQVSVTVRANENKLVPVELRLNTSDSVPSLSMHWTTNEDDRPRPLPLRRLLLPWADTREKEMDEVVPEIAPELEGGSWARGYREFFGEQAACSKCHAMYQRGGSIGPDLSNLIHRDYASVLRDITHPSFAMNPDYLPYQAVLADGRVLAGVVHAKGKKISIGDSQGNITQLDRSDVDTLEPSAISTMPEGVPKLLGPERMRDLLTFLLTPPPKMPRDLAGLRPAPRTQADVKAILAGAPDPAKKTRPIDIVLVAGPKDHGPGEHDYPAWQRAWAELLAAAQDVQVSTAWEWPSPEQFQQADVVVFYKHGDWNDDRAADIDAYLKRGGGLVYIHWAVDGGAHGAEMAQRIGLAAGGPIAFRHGELTLKFDRKSRHPIIRNFDRLALTDETYWKLVGSVTADGALASAIEEGQPQPQIWAVEPQNGRVFVSIPGHYSWTFDDPLFRILLLRGIAWTAREPVDRFNDLIWPGADLAN